MKVPVCVSAVVLLIASSSNAQTLGTSAAAPSPVSSFSSTTGLFSPASGVVCVTSAGTEKMRITANGIGIGTVTPLGTLQVTSSISGTDPYNMPYNSVALGMVTQTQWTATGISMANVNGGSKIGVIGFNGDNMFFGQLAGVSIATTQMVLATNGSLGVGIGTGPPASKFDVSGGMSLGSSYAGVSAAPTNGMIIQGNVGIGTTNPTELLQVYATSGYPTLSIRNLSTSGNGASMIKFANTNDTQAGAIQYNIPTDVGANVLFMQNNYGPVAFYTGTSGSSSERMRIVSSGNVGIGTTVPVNTLTVVGNGTGIAQIGDAGCSQNYTGLTLGQTTTTNDCTKYNILSSPTIQHLFLNRPTGNAIIFREGNGGNGTNPTNQMIIASGGNVGIGLGTNLPDTLLSLGGQSAQTIDMIRETTASTAGNSLTVRAGGSTVGGTNLNGGTLNLTSGISTGTGSSGINLNIYKAGTTGSADNSPTTALALTGAGLNLSSGVYQVGGTQIAASNLLNGVNGSGAIVLAISPTLTTPNIGAATGTSLSVTGNITTTAGQIGVGTATPTAGASIDLSYRTDALALPVGTTGQEPASPTNGMMRYNSTTNTVEAYANGVWGPLTPSGSDVLIASATASNSANIQFTNIPSGYDQYELRYTAVVPVSSGAKLIALLSENNGSSYITSNYTYGAGDGYSNNSGAFYGASGDSQIELSGTIAVSTSLSGTSGKLVLTSLGSSSAYKMFNTQFVVSSSGLLTSGFLGGIYTGDTNAVNALEVSFNTGNISTGNFALYGIRNH